MEYNSVTRNKLLEHKHARQVPGPWQEINRKVYYYFKKEYALIEVGGGGGAEAQAAPRKPHWNL